MADEQKQPVKFGIVDLIIGVVAVVVAILVISVINTAASLGIPDWLATAIGAAIGVAGWLGFKLTRQKAE
ncbi:hypothetical protein [Cucumibacter marinus]|uniref:hypothetical protein n=1 Tax=Cucumibacter marinus TaxID=1121252 RepID=UPI0004118FD2|nr:hypothetical protein [Cucumibacter marinus]